MTVLLGQLPSLTIAYDADADATIERDILAGPATVKSATIVNADAGVRYVKLFDDINPVVGTTAPDEIWMIPASGTVTLHFGDKPLEFPTGLSMAAVTTGGTAGTTPPTDLKVTLACIPGVE